MRRRDKEIKEKENIEAILHAAQECRIAFAVNNQPFLVPVNFAYFNNALYIHSAPQGKKIDCIRQNPQVCFEATSYAEIKSGTKACDWTTYYRSVIGYGNAVILSSPKEKIAG